MPGQRRKCVQIAAVGLILAAGTVLLWLDFDHELAPGSAHAPRQQVTGSTSTAGIDIEGEEASFIEAVQAAFERPAVAPEQESLDVDEFASEFLYLVAIRPPELPRDNQRVIGAYAAIYASFLDELRALPGLALLELESADSEIDAELIDFVLEVTGVLDPLEDPVWSFTVKWFSTRNGEGTASEDQLESNLRPIEELGIDVARELSRFPFPPREARLPEVVAQALDVNLSSEVRIDALDELHDIPRRFEFIGIDAARMTAVAAVEIVVNAVDSEIRARVWRAMIEAGVDDPYLIGPLIDSLLQDQSEEVRTQAVKLLVRKFSEDQRVLTALDFAIDADSSPKVQALARWEFLDESGKRGYIRETLMNDSLPVTERFDMLVADLGDLHDYVDRFTVVPVLSRAVAAVNEQDTAATRSERESVIYGQMVPMLIDVLQGNEHEQLRMTAASMLVRYADDPQVRPALERAAIDDPSLTMRLVLSRALER